jgi:hypothetical protein
LDVPRPRVPGRVGDRRHRRPARARRDHHAGRARVTAGQHRALRRVLDAGGAAALRVGDLVDHIRSSL